MALIQCPKCGGKNIHSKSRAVKYPKLIALFAACTILISLLSACGNNNSGQPDTDSSGSDNQKNSQIEPAEPEENYIAYAKEYVLKTFETCDITYKNHELQITASTHGLANSLGEVKKNGNNTLWTKCKEGISSTIEDLDKQAKSMGYDDIAITFIVQNDIAPDECLLKFQNKEFVYDAIEDENATLSIELVIPESTVYSGSGDDVVKLEPLIEPFNGGYVLHITGNSAERHFAVKGYDANGDSTELFVNTTSAYDGITIDPDLDTTTLEVKATGDWTIEVESVHLLDKIAVGETCSGTGDSVLIVSSHGSTATISGNAEGHHFAVKSYDSQRANLLVNTTEEYNGTVMLTGDPLILEIKATGSWTITFD